MPPESHAPDDPQEWLNRARSNLVLADNRLPGVYLEDLCFEAQQAAEKALKALLIHRGIGFPYVHDLSQLLTLLHTSGLAIPDEVLEATTLSKFAVATRYPGVVGPVSDAMYSAALMTAQDVVRWVEGFIQR